MNSDLWIPLSFKTQSHTFPRYRLQATSVVLIRKEMLQGWILSLSLVVFPADDTSENTGREQVCDGLHLSLCLAKLWLQTETIRDAVSEMDDVTHFETVLDKLQKRHSSSLKAYHELQQNVMPFFRGKGFIIQWGAFRLSWDSFWNNSAKIGHCKQWVKWEEKHEWTERELLKWHRGSPGVLEEVGGQDYRKIMDTSKSRQQFQGVDLSFLAR